MEMDMPYMEMGMPYMFQDLFAHNSQSFFRACLYIHVMWSVFSSAFRIYGHIGNSRLWKDSKNTSAGVSGIVPRDFT